jgi:hypothetical protein
MTARRFGRKDRLVRSVSGNRDALSGLVLFQAGDLVGVHFSADLEQDVGCGFFEFGAGLRKAVNLGVQGRLVEGLAANQGAHAGFFLLQILQAAYQRGPVGVEDAVHPVLLVRAQLEVLGEVLVIPPAARRPQHEATAWPGAGANGVRR